MVTTRWRTKWRIPRWRNPRRIQRWRILRCRPQLRGRNSLSLLGHYRRVLAGLIPYNRTNNGTSTFGGMESCYTKTKYAESRQHHHLLHKLSMKRYRHNKNNLLLLQSPFKKERKRRKKQLRSSTPKSLKPTSGTFTGFAHEPRYLRAVPLEGGPPTEMEVVQRHQPQTLSKYRITAAYFMPGYADDRDFTVLQLQPKPRYGEEKNNDPPAYTIHNMYRPESSQ